MILKKKRIILSLLVAVLLLTFSVAAAGCGAPASQTGQAPAQLQTVNVAYDDSVGEAGILLGDHLGFFAKQGIKINYIKFNSGADEFTALANGQVDESRGIISAGLFNAAAQGIGIKLAADGGHNIPGKSYFELTLKKGLNVPDYKDLKGKKIAIASIGTINELMLDKALEKGGLKDTDVKKVIVDSFPDMNTAVANGAADGCMQIDPLITKGVSDGILEWWKDASEYAPDEEVSVVMFSPQFAAKTDLADKFMVGYLQGVRAYNDALVSGNKNQQQVVDILTQYTFVKDAKTMLAMHPPGLDPNGTVPKDGVVSDQQWYMQKGLVKKAANVDNMIDTSYLDFALKQLGPYQKP